MAESATEKGAEAAIPMEAAKMNESGKEVPPGNFKVIMLGATGATGCYVVGELLSSKVGLQTQRGMYEFHCFPFQTCSLYIRNNVKMKFEN